MHHWARYWECHRISILEGFWDSARASLEWPDPVLRTGKRAGLLDTLSPSISVVLWAGHKEGEEPALPGGLAPFLDCAKMWWINAPARANCCQKCRGSLLGGIHRPLPCTNSAQLTECAGNVKSCTFPGSYQGGQEWRLPAILCFLWITPHFLACCSCCLIPKTLLAKNGSHLFFIVFSNVQYQILNKNPSRFQ